MQKIDMLHKLRDSLAWALIDDDQDEVSALSVEIEMIEFDIAQLDNLPPIRSRSSRGFYELISKTCDDKCQIGAT